MRAAGRGERDRFAIEDQLVRRQFAHAGDDLRHGRADFVEGAGIDPHVGPALVDLDPGTVHLPLEVGFGTERGQRLGDVGRRLRKHRRDRREHLQAERFETGGAARQRGLRERPEPAGQHRRAPHGGNRQRRGRRDRIDHHARERALAQLADDQSQQEILLRFGRPGEQFAQDTGALGTGSGAALTGDSREVRIDRLQRQRRGRGGRHVGGSCQAAIAEADLALRQQAGEPVDGDCDLVGGEGSQECGQRGDLRQAAAAAGDHARRLDQRRETGGVHG